MTTINYTTTIPAAINNPDTLRALLVNTRARFRNADICPDATVYLDGKPYTGTLVWLNPKDGNIQFGCEFDYSDSYLELYFVSACTSEIMLLRWSLDLLNEYCGEKGLDPESDDFDWEDYSNYVCEYNHDYTRPHEAIALEFPDFYDWDDVASDIIAGKIDLFTLCYGNL